MIKFHTLLSVSILFCFTNCQTTKLEKVTPAFYYWKGSFLIEDTGINLLSNLDVNKLYLKLFDVDFDNNPYVKSRIYFSQQIPEQITEITPVIYITNKTIKNIDSTDIEDLSQKIIVRLNNEIKRTLLVGKVSEIQIDCDWTNTTRDKYFYLLRLIKQSTKYIVSATIRLHQYKYHRNNIPPIDKGLLMCYNVDDIANFNVNNSLFSKAEVMKYIEDVKYPLTLDLALPTFGWGVLFNASEKFEGITEYINLKEIQVDTSFITTDRKNVFTAKIEQYKYGNYWNVNDKVRVENINMAEVEEIKNYLIDKLNNPAPNIILFHFDESNLNNYTLNEIKGLFNSKKQITP
jgi:hypothetical protein